eukprot:5468575-Pleurochrysis_carterae.AAC.3
MDILHHNHVRKARALVLKRVVPLPHELHPQRYHRAALPRLEGAREGLFAQLFVDVANVLREQVKPRLHGRVERAGGVWRGDVGRRRRAQREDGCALAHAAPHAHAHRPAAG